MKTEKCKFCDKYFDDSDEYAAHIEAYHEDLIPPEMTGYQFYYYLKTGKKSGKCIICSKETTWNTKTKKYKRFCDNPKCKDKYVAVFKKRMIGKYGKITLLNDPEQQKKMLANRKISGVYKWHDGKEITYTGTYELSFLRFLDEIMDYDSSDVISPSPHTYFYTYEEKQHFYIPDLFIPSLNLEIEIKDSEPGGPNENKHWKIQEVDRVKEKLKDNVMRSNSNSFNYLKITNKNNSKFFEYLEKAKYNFSNNISRPIIMI